MSAPSRAPQECHCYRYAGTSERAIEVSIQRALGITEPFTLAEETTDDVLPISAALPDGIVVRVVIQAQARSRGQDPDPAHRCLDQVVCPPLLEADQYLLELLPEYLNHGL